VPILRPTRALAFEEKGVVMEPTSIVTYAVLALLISRAFLPRRFAWPLVWIGIFIAGAFVVADTPTIPWAVKLVLWLSLVSAAAWRWHRDRSSRTELA